MNDQFTRWLCPKCEGDGIDSWNKAIFDGIKHDGTLPNPWIFGDNCQRCGWPCVVRYTTPDAAPHAILGPVGLDDPRTYSYEDEAFATMTRDPASGVQLEPSATRDADWSHGCLSAAAQFQ